MRFFLFKLSVTLLLLFGFESEYSHAMEGAFDIQRQTKKRTYSEIREDASDEEAPFEGERAFKRQHFLGVDGAPSENQRTGPDNMELDTPVYNDVYDDDPLAVSALDLYRISEKDIHTGRLDSLPCDTIELTAFDMKLMREYVDSTSFLKPNFVWLNLPAELWQHIICTYFDLYDLGRFEQVSRTTCNVLCIDYVWAEVGHVIQEDYKPPFALNRQTIIAHLLRSMILTLPDEEVENKVKELLKVAPAFLSASYTRFQSSIIDFRGGGLYDTRNGFVDEFHNAYADKLIALKDKGLFKRKIKGFSYGVYGYGINPLAASQLYNQCVEQGNPEEIDQDSGLACVEQGDVKEIHRKINGLLNGQDGYEYNPQEAKELNDQLVKRGDPEAIDGKLEGLCTGWFGYEFNPEALLETIRELAQNNHSMAVGYLFAYSDELEKNNKELFVVFHEIADILISKNNRVAHTLKALGMLKGIWGYEQDIARAKEYIRRHYIAL